MQIAVGSTNPAKQKATKWAFDLIGIEHSIVGIDVPSGVSSQPLSDEETLQGAINRAQATLGAGAYDLGIGLEGGVLETEHGMMLCNWCAIASREDGRLAIGGGVRILLPDAIARGVRVGIELGTMIDEWAGSTGISKGEGTIGILTQGKISRAQMFRDSVICAYSRLIYP